MVEIRRLGVLTSGGDAPGMNAAVRAVVRCAAAAGREVLGVRSGYEGLMRGDFTSLGPRDVSNIIQQGGTVLGTSRAERFHTPEGRAEAAAAMKEAGMDALVVAGGNGSFRGAQALHGEWELPVAGVPATIDNDVGGTDATIGFDSAVNTAVDAIDRLRDTAFSHERAFFVEVMGRHSGAIAVTSALAGGAEEVLVPERPHELERLIENIRQATARGKRSLIVVVAEGDEVGGAQAAADRVSAALSLRVRVSVLGYIQRGGRPTAADRILASRLGAAGVHGLLQGERAFMVGVRGREVFTCPLSEAWTTPRPDHRELLELCAGLAQ